jgi:hypothetical protein
VSDSKPYRDLYRVVKESFSYSQEYVDIALSSKTMTHFFTDEERSKLQLEYGSDQLLGK